jgi:hypothetical protein
MKLKGNSQLQSAVEHNKNEIILNKRDHEDIGLRFLLKIALDEIDNAVIFILS